MAGSTAHPTPRFYWIVAAVLAVVTAAEIAIGYADIATAIKVTGLFTLGGLKFAAVVAFFMHLRFDKPLYRSLFLIGLAGAIPIFIVVLLTFEALV
jgi:cytochrome c oxidase subunit IV